MVTNTTSWWLLNLAAVNAKVPNCYAPPLPVSEILIYRQLGLSSFRRGCLLQRSPLQNHFFESFLNCHKIRTAVDRLRRQIACWGGHIVVPTASLYFPIASG